jgi:hypothetical protein
MYLVNSILLAKYVKTPFELVEYNRMEHNGMKYNNVPLFGFEK